MPLFIRNDLRLLDARLEQLYQAPFFREGLRDYIGQMRLVVERLNERRQALPEEIVLNLARQVWSATRYLAGSVSREIPYEVVYGLDLALSDWVASPPKYIVTTAFLAEQNYHFEGVPEQFYKLAHSLLDVSFDQRLVQVALPQLYKHQPLNNTVLYHELGHFLDEQHGVSKLMALMSASNKRPIQREQLNHAAEFFADLFAACYVGDAIATMIERFAPNEGDSYTHPATSRRGEVVRAFLNGSPHPIVKNCNLALAALGLPCFRKHFIKPEIKSRLDNVLPYPIQSREEVHGILLAGHEYLTYRLERLDGKWEHVSEGDAIRMINDLIEKSLRNWMIREKWDKANATQD